MANTKPSTKADVFAALTQKCGFTIREDAEGAKQLRIVGRLVPERWPFFLPVVRKLLLASKKPGNPWTCDISKSYLEHNDKVFYTWRIIFQSADVQAQYASIISTIRSAEQPARVELDRQLLPGYKPGDVRGGVNERGKGVSEAGSLPLALTRPR